MTIRAIVKIFFASYTYYLVNFCRGLFKIAFFQEKLKVGLLQDNFGVIDPATS